MLAIDNYMDYTFGKSRNRNTKGIKSMLNKARGDLENKKKCENSTISKCIKHLNFKLINTVHQTSIPCNANVFKMYSYEKFLDLPENHLGQ